PEALSTPVVPRLPAGAHDMVCASDRRSWRGVIELRSGSFDLRRGLLGRPGGSVGQIVAGWVCTAAAACGSLSLQIPHSPQVRKEPGMARYQISTAAADPVRPYLE